jgi:hypothetical protein
MSPRVQRCVALSGTGLQTPHPRAASSIAVVCPGGRAGGMSGSLGVWCRCVRACVLVGGSPTVLSERVPVWRDVLASWERCRQAGRQDDVRNAVVAACSSRPAAPKRASPTVSPPCLLPACVHCVVLLVHRRLTRSRMALAPYILGSTAIRYRHEGCVVDAWMFARCGQQTVFGLLLPLRCICHTASLRGLRSGSCTCLERDHACILAAPVGHD